MHIFYLCRSGFYVFFILSWYVTGDLSQCKCELHDKLSYILEKYFRDKIGKFRSTADDELTRESCQL